jgi:hypothetical protein
MAVNQVAISEAGNVQLSVEGAQETQIVLAVPGIQGPAGASASGTVEYVDLSGVSPIAVSGDPVTTSGSFEVSIDESLLSIAPSQLSDGTLPSGVTVSGISLAASINDLSDVDTATVAPASGEALVWNGSEWNPGPAGAEAAGNAIGQIQYNDGTSPPGLAASSGLVWDDTGKVLEVGGDINLDDGGSFQTTLQLVTPTAARTITFPDATGTVGLVAGSTGQLVFNNAGAYSGLSGVTTDGTDVTLTGRFISSLNGAASAPPGTFTGTWFTGGTATTTKPQVLIEPTGTTSTAWSTSGTGLGVNAASGFAGRLLDLQVNGTSQLSVSSLGSPLVGLTSAYDSGTAKGYYFASGNLSIRSTGAGIGVYSRINNFPSFYFGSNGPDLGHRISSDVEFGWSSTSVATGVVDLTLARDAADTLAQRRTTNAQTYHVYDTYTSATNYHRIALATARATLSAVSGASVTATALIPAGAVVMGVTSKVTTALGTTNSTTGYKIGTGADDDRWGDITGTAEGTTSDNRDWTAGTIECFPAATDVIVTATGGDFDATGVIYLSVQYMTGQAD